MIAISPDDPQRFADSLDLRYVSDEEPGITRRRHGRGFRFLNAEGKPIRDRGERTRFESLAIPPAWQSVWICIDPRGHLQATGRDARNRKQYRYHEVWRRSANQAKFARLAEFGDALPRIRERVRRDLRREGLDRRRVLAAVVRILDRGYLRLGNDTYTAANATFGATTLRPRHVAIDEDRIDVCFIGKHHRDRRVTLCDPLAASVISLLSQSRRQRLFRFREGGRWHDLRAAMVNQYLAKSCRGVGATAKWFRTWHGSRLLLERLAKAAEAEPRRLKRHVSTAIRDVADELGNRPATCRKYYVHPTIAEAYLSGSLSDEDPPARRGLKRSERQLLALI